MKTFVQKVILSLILSTFCLETFARSVITNPNDLQIPSVSALPACAAVDYDKIVFLTTTNHANVYSGSGWVEIATGGGDLLSLPFAGSMYSTTSFVR